MTTLQPTETDLTRFYSLFPQPALARDLFNIVEGHRIDSAIRRAYPGIRRDMEAIQAASVDRRPDLAGLPESQAVAEALLQHTLGTAPDDTMLPEATRALIARAIGLLDEMSAADTRVADAAAITGRIYIMIEEHLADPSRRDAQPTDGAEPPSRTSRTPSQSRRSSRTSPRAPAARTRSTSPSSCRRS